MDSMDRPDPRVDPFEIFRMRTLNDAEMIEVTRALVEQDNLDPSLADAIEDAIAGDDHTALKLATVRLLEAVAEARGLI